MLHQQKLLALLVRETKFRLSSPTLVQRSAWVSLCAGEETSFWLPISVFPGCSFSSFQMERTQKKLKQMNYEINLDLEVHSQQYVDHAKIDRLLFIAKHSSSLQIDAYKLALQEIEKSFDIEKYTSTLTKLNQLLEQKKLPQVDTDLEWISKRSQSISEERHRLDQELASYRSNLIKESIRMGQNDLGEHFYRVGDLTSALKCFINTRDYLTSPMHIVDMCCRVVEVHAVYIGQYGSRRASEYWGLFVQGKTGYQYS
jgi:hypothetical protein